MSVKVQNKQSVIKIVVCCLVKTNKKITISNLQYSKWDSGMDNMVDSAFDVLDLKLKSTVSFSLYPSCISLERGD